MAKYRIHQGQLEVWDNSPTYEFGQIWLPICVGCKNGPLDENTIVCGECDATEAEKE